MGYILGPFQFGILWSSQTQKRYCGGVLLRLLLFGAVAAVFVTWAWARSPDISSDKPSDVLEEITAPFYRLIRDNEYTMRFVSHFVVYVLYLLVTCFLLHYVRSDFWVLIQLGSAFLLALLISSVIGQPPSPLAIRYWRHGFFPLEDLISDNIVCFHLVISWVCSHALMRSAETFFVTLGLWVYNIFLCLFLVATRNTSSVALFIAGFCALSADVFKLQLEYWWTLLFAFMSYLKGYCCPTKIRAAAEVEADRERDKLYANENNYTISLSDTEQEKKEEEEESEEQEPQSTLFENVRHGPIGSIASAASGQSLTDL